MAIYRPRRARWPAFVGGLALGVVIGIVGALALVGDRPSDLADAARRMRQELDGAAGLLEVALIEYRESVVDGRVISEPEYRASQAAVARSRARYDSAAAALAMIDPARASDVSRRYDDLVGPMDEPADPDRVEETSAALQEVLRAPGS